MKITPVDISHKTFDKKMFGIDEVQVSDFLSEIAGTLEDVLHERNSLREKLREKDLQLAEYKERDQILKNTIATAGQMAEKMRADAEREARLILSDADQKADLIGKEARDSLRKTYQDISELKRIRMQFEANLRALAQAHLSLLEQGDKYVPHAVVPANTAQESPTPASIA